ncbi:MAG: hypothetical protein JW984_15180 [Deltaproteobacteria bacterium]|uniref:ASCH domain-containing protein n=1 Tax=Candidatus Zymogenus saltonus TaxID=2844893 RepID=A0A9D8KHI2_9DELT|nr:hypothetical protein [Candidatus Zymogenus saltonus]
MLELLKFTKKNQELIARGRKICTARRKIHGDPRVAWVTMMRLREVKEHFYGMEGYDSPEEFEKVWRGIHRGRFNPNQIVYVHFGWFGEVPPQPCSLSGWIESYYDGLGYAHQRVVYTECSPLPMEIEIQDFEIEEWEENNNGT